VPIIYVSDTNCLYKNPFSGEGRSLARLRGGRSTYSIAIAMLAISSVNNILHISSPTPSFRCYYSKELCIPYIIDIDYCFSHLGLLLQLLPFKQTNMTTIVIKFTTCQCIQANQRLDVDRLLRLLNLSKHYKSSSYR